MTNPIVEIEGKQLHPSMVDGVSNQMQGFKPTRRLYTRSYTPTGVGLIVRTHLRGIFRRKIVAPFDRVGGKLNRSSAVADIRDTRSCTPTGVGLIVRTHLRVVLRRKNDVPFDRVGGQLTRSDILSTKLRWSSSKVQSSWDLVT